MQLVKFLLKRSTGATLQVIFRCETLSWVERRICLILLQIVILCAYYGFNCEQIILYSCIFMRFWFGQGCRYAILMKFVNGELFKLI